MATTEEQDVKSKRSKRLQWLTTIGVHASLIALLYAGWSNPGWARVYTTLTALLWGLAALTFLIRGVVAFCAWSALDGLKKPLLSKSSREKTSSAVTGLRAELPATSRGAFRLADISTAAQAVAVIYVGWFWAGFWLIGILICDVLAHIARASAQSNFEKIDELESARAEQDAEPC
jgi:hypothetical protein